jgi:hypothetical protein
MLKRVLIILVILSGMTIIVPVAFAASCVKAGASEGIATPSADIIGNCPGGPQGSGGHSEPGPSPITDTHASNSPPPPPAEPFWAVHPATGEPCIGLLPSPGLDPESELAIAWASRIADMIRDPRLAGADSRYCTRPGPVADPSGPARAFARSIPIPAPRPEIAPGIAVTGLPSYLVIADQEGFTVTETLPGFGLMQVTLEPVAFDIDWGDGATERVADGRTGVSWEQSQSDPGAAIRHTYTVRDLETVVTIEAEWLATWSVGGFSGIVPGLAIDTSFTLPVQEYRAVRVTP